VSEALVYFCSNPDCEYHREFPHNIWGEDDHLCWLPETHLVLHDGIADSGSYSGVVDHKLCYLVLGPLPFILDPYPIYLCRDCQAKDLSKVAYRIRDKYKDIV